MIAVLLSALLLAEPAPPRPATAGPPAAERERAPAPPREEAPARAPAVEAPDDDEAMLRELELLERLELLENLELFDPAADSDPR